MSNPTTNTPSPDEDRELIERIGVLRRERGVLYAVEGDEVDYTLAKAADRLESLLSDRAKLEEALRGIMDAIDTPQCGDSSVWDDLIRCDDFGGPSPLDRARTALNRTTDHTT